MEVTIPEDLVSLMVNSSLKSAKLQIQNITTMSRYNAEYPFAVAFPPQPMTNVLAEWLSKHDVKQAHVAGNAFYYYMHSIHLMMIYLKKRRSMPT